MLEEKWLSSRSGISSIPLLVGKALSILVNMLMTDLQTNYLMVLPVGKLLSMESF